VRNHKIKSNKKISKETIKGNKRGCEEKSKKGVGKSNKECREE
jgi:hypothetical protein